MGRTAKKSVRESFSANLEHFESLETEDELELRNKDRSAKSTMVDKKDMKVGQRLKNGQTLHEAGPTVKSD